MCQAQCLRKSVLKKKSFSCKNSTELTLLFILHQKVTKMGCGNSSPNTPGSSVKLNESDIDPARIVEFLTKDGGKWFGDDGKDNFFSEESFVEYTTFEPIPKGLQNIGKFGPLGPKEDVFGVSYHTKLYKTTTKKDQLHDECGYILLVFDRKWFSNKTGPVQVYKIISVVRGESILASGEFNYNDGDKKVIELSMEANVENNAKNEFGILQIPWLKNQAITKSFKYACTIDMENDTFSYKETSEIYLGDELKINHRDSNNFKRV